MPEYQQYMSMRQWLRKYVMVGYENLYCILICSKGHYSKIIHNSSQHALTFLIEIHYENVPVIFHSCKNNFQMKNCDMFLIFALNIDRGYTL